MRKLQFGIFGMVLLAAAFSASGQDIDDIRKQCLGIGMVDKTNLLVTHFHSITPTVNSKSIAGDLSDKIIEGVQLVNCFTVNKQPSEFVPEGTQAIITGSLKDYFTSEGALGKPRINFDIEIRKAVTQELLATKNISITGKLYLGAGNNKSLANVWKEAVDEAVIFLYKQLPAMTTLAKAKESKEKLLDTTLSFQTPVKTKSILAQQKEYADELRARDKKYSQNTSEYYNDSVVYKEFPKVKGDQYLEYSINGKKYAFYYNSSDSKQAAGFSLIKSITSTKHGVRIQVRPSMVTTQLSIEMFYPLKYPRTRWFYFGSDTAHDSRVPAAKEDVSFEIHLLGGLKAVSDWTLTMTATDRYDFFATNESKYADQSNIESGYVQILNFSPSNFGSIEAFFKFQTKAYIDSKGKNIPAMKIEGRFRVRGGLGEGY